MLTEPSPSNDWDQWYLQMARHVASKSKDPSTQVGAVIADPERRPVSMGFNGFPQGIADDDRLLNREVKLQIILHAEENALAFADRTAGCTLYVWPLPPCAHCTALALQHHIARIVCPKHVPERWQASVSLARSLAQEGGIIWHAY